MLKTDETDGRFYRVNEEVTSLPVTSYQLPVTSYQLLKKLRSLFFTPPYFYSTFFVFLTPVLYSFRRVIYG